MCIYLFIYLCLHQPIDVFIAYIVATTCSGHMGIGSVICRDNGFSPSLRIIRGSTWTALRSFPAGIRCPALQRPCDGHGSWPLFVGDSVLDSVSRSGQDSSLRSTGSLTQDRTLRSGRLSLTQGADKPSPAARMLLRLFFTPAEKLGFKEPMVPAPFIITCYDGQSCLLDSFDCLRLSNDPGRRTGVFKAQRPDGQRVVVKFGNDLAIQHEVITCGSYNGA